MWASCVQLVGIYNLVDFFFICRKDATLKELMSLVKEVNPDARRRGTVFGFAIVFPDNRRGGFILKEIGSTTTGHKGPEDQITLESKKFQIGDFIDVAIQTPRMGRRDRPYWTCHQYGQEGYHSLLACLEFTSQANITIYMHVFDISNHVFLSCSLIFNINLSSSQFFHFKKIWIW